MAGGFLGNPLLGQQAGHGLGAALSKWMGFGDYSVSKNTIVDKASTGIPFMHKTGQSVMIRHKEFIGTISGSNAFTVQYELTINPGLAQTFPWLSGIAGRFQEYEVKGMVYHYVPTSGTFNGTTAALGSVMLQTTYRATDTAPVSKAEMLNEYWAGEVVPCETMAHPIECDPKENPFAVHYVRTNVVEGSEPLLYDLGKTFVATQGMVDTGIIGDLWVTYEIELKKPVVSSNASLLTGAFSATWNDPVSTAIFDTTQTTLFGATPLTFIASNTIVVPKRAAKYVVYCRIDPDTSFAGAAGTIGWPNPIIIVGTSISLFLSNVGDVVNAAGARTYNALFYTFGIQCDGSGSGTVRIPAWDATGSASLLTVTIVELPI